MEVDMLHAAGQALLIILDPHRLVYLFAGVCMGLGLGLLPGIGGIAGTAMLLPFTYELDPHAAFALLLGLGATTTTADPISAILFGVRGHAASAATTLDGYPLTGQGQAGRALGSSYMSAMMGGLFGAALVGVSLPILRPLMLYIGSPELLAFAVFGLSMVAVLSGIRCAASPPAASASCCPWSAKRRRAGRSAGRSTNSPIPRSGPQQARRRGFPRRPPSGPSGPCGGAASPGQNPRRNCRTASW
jgi:hypothetical protein